MKRMGAKEGKVQQLAFAACQIVKNSCMAPKVPIEVEGEISVRDSRAAFSFAGLQFFTVLTAL